MFPDRSPESCKNTGQLPLDQFHDFFEGMMDQFRMEALQASAHAQMELHQQEINRDMVVRVAGCNDHGQALDEAGIQHDAAIIGLLHAPQVVTPKAIRDQMIRFRKELDAVAGDYLQLDTKKFDFMELGGHIPTSHLPKLLVDIVRGTTLHTYALITEYMSKERGHQIRVPFAYHIGFTQMPHNDARFPNLEAGDIAGSKGAVAAKHYEDIWAPWRVGVLRELTPAVCKSMRTLGIEVPEYMMDWQGTRRGLNNLQKVVYGTAAKELMKQWIMYNTAVLRPHGEMSIEMPNTALRESNSGMFFPMGERNHTDQIVDEDGEVVADVGWHVFGNKPKSLLTAVSREGGVLTSKGGYENLEPYLRVGHILAEVTRKRELLFEA